MKTHTTAWRNTADKGQVFSNGKMVLKQLVVNSFVIRKLGTPPQFLDDEFERYHMPFPQSVKVLPVYRTYVRSVRISPIF
jgi:hypothetical protein